MKLPRYITAYFDSHPAATVVVDSIHATIGVRLSERIADHRMPDFGEVLPVQLSGGHANKNWAQHAADLRMGTLLSWHHRRNVVEMAYNHFIRKDLPAKKPKR